MCLVNFFDERNKLKWTCLYLNSLAISFQQPISIIPDIFLRCLSSNFNLQPDPSHVFFRGFWVLGFWNRCRWNPLSQLIAVKYTSKLLNFFDVSKNRMLLVNPKEIDRESMEYYWILCITVLSSQFYDWLEQRWDFDCLCWER